MDLISREVVARYLQKFYIPNEVFTKSSQEDYFGCCSWKERSIK
jgi:hypothetical protein